LMSGLIALEAALAELGFESNRMRRVGNTCW